MHMASQAPMPKPGQKAAIYMRFANQPPAFDDVAVPKSSKAAIYCRTASTHPDDFLAIGLQRDRVRAFAFRVGYSICEEYWDDGYSGNDLNRPSLTKMKEDIKAGKIDTIIVSCINRIARDYFLLANCLEEFKAQGVRIIAADGSHELKSFADAATEFVRCKKKLKVI